MTQSEFISEIARKASARTTESTKVVGWVPSPTATGDPYGLFLVESNRSNTTTTTPHWTTQ